LSNHHEHHRSILLLDDNKEFTRPVTRWLSQAGFFVSHVATLDEAIQNLKNRRFHLAIVDVRLDDNDETNKEGMDFLRIKNEYGLRDIMPAIVLTANATTDNVLEAFTQYNVFSYIKKEPGYREKLLHEVNRAFDEEVQINFDLKYAEHSDDVLQEVIKDINWSGVMAPDPDLLVSEAYDLFAKLFRNAESILLKKLKPGLSGAGLVQVSPLWLGSGLGPARVVKMDRLNKSLTEKYNYEVYVKNSLPLATTQVSYERCQYLGAAVFTFAEDASVNFMEFDDYYRKTSLKEIKLVEESLHGLILRTCRFWYDHTKTEHANLQNLYFQAFNLERSRVAQELKVLLSNYNLESPTLVLPDLDVPQINPLHWLRAHERHFILAVKMCITHGDMTGRNIMVDESGKCWMIDFLRTYESHSLRDFVILESDLKYRQGPLLPDQEFLEIEKSLIHQGVNHSDAKALSRWDKETRKMFSVIMTVRDLARQVAFGVANPSQMDLEYKISLLMATLNVIRLRHMLRERKLQALKSAILLCESLED